MEKESRMTLSFLIPYFNGLRTVYISREQSIINQYMIKCRALLIHSTVSNEHNQSMTRLKIAAPSLPSPSILLCKGPSFQGFHPMPWKLFSRTLLAMVNNNKKLQYSNNSFHQEEGFSHTNVMLI